MTADYDLYGPAVPTLEQARAMVEEALGFSIVLHESFYVGEYDRAGLLVGEHFELRHNYDSLEDAWTEPSHKTARFLLYVNETERAAALRPVLSRLPRVTHLRTWSA
jgi:hypothetical protein